MKKKVLVAYYSHTGNTEFLANEIKNELDADVLRIIPKKDIPQGISKFFWISFQKVFRGNPAIKQVKISLNKYDLIFLGFPVWMNAPAPAIYSLLEEYPVINKKIALFCSNGGQYKRPFDELTTKLAKNKSIVIEEFAFTEPLKNQTEASKKIKKWLQKFKK